MKKRIRKKLENRGHCFTYAEFDDLYQNPEYMRLFGVNEKGEREEFLHPFFALVPDHKRFKRPPSLRIRKE